MSYVKPSYTRKNWVNNQAPALNASNMNSIDTGLIDTINALDDVHIEAITQAQLAETYAQEAYGHSESSHDYSLQSGSSATESAESAEEAAQSATDAEAYKDAAETAAVNAQKLIQFMNEYDPNVTYSRNMAVTLGADSDNCMVFISRVDNNRNHRPYWTDDNSHEYWFALTRTIGGSGASSWSELTGKPFTTIGSGLEVESNALKLANSVQTEIDGKANKTTISDAWNSTKSYAIGNYCIYNDTLWKCKAANTGVTPTEGTYWTAVKVGDEIGALNVSLTNISAWDLVSFSTSSGTVVSGSEIRVNRAMKMAYASIQINGNSADTTISMSDITARGSIFKYFIARNDYNNVDVHCRILDSRIIILESCPVVRLFVMFPIV